WQIERCERKIVPGWSQGRREQKHATLAGCCFNQRGASIFKPGQDRCVCARLGAEVADDIRRRQPATFLKHFEDWMIELYFRNRNALARFCLYCFTQSGGQDCLQRPVESVSLCFWTSRHDHLSAGIYKPHQRIGERRRDRSGIVQNYESVVRDAAWIDRAGA